MPLLSPDQLNPLGSLPGAMMKGLEMRQMLQTAADQHQEFQQRQAQNVQAMSAQDIMNRMTLGQNSRPVDNNGIVADDSTPAPVAQQAPAPAAAAPAQNFTPANYSPAPAPVAQAAPIAQPSQPIMRKADPARTVTYTDAQGNKQQRELYTPQEQVARTAAAKKQMEEGTGIPVSIPDGSGEAGKTRTVYIQPEQLDSFLKTTGQNQPIKLGPNGELPSTVPAFMVPSTVR